MGNNPIRISKLGQVLKLHCQGQNKLHISTTTGLSRNTVKKYLRVFFGLKTNWEQINQLPDKELDELFCKEPELIVDDRLVPLHELGSSNPRYHELIEIVKPFFKVYEFALTSFLLTIKIP